MAHLLIIADDITGALDTGVQFSKLGIPTRVALEIRTDLPDCEVLVINAETRHLSPKEAYDKVFTIVTKAIKKEIRYIYKKTDSALRGNIGAELAALREASKQEYLPFLPAFPRMNRITVDGIHYIDGTPVAESVFGRDPFEPVTKSDVSELIRLQTDSPVFSIALGEKIFETGAEPGILVFDAQTDEDLELAGRRILDAWEQRIFAGCAGFGSILPKLIQFSIGPTERSVEFPKQFTVICGSVNPITCGQTDRAEQAGFVRIRLTPDQKLTPNYWRSETGKTESGELIRILKSEKRAILDSNECSGEISTREIAETKGMTIEDARQQISRSIGEFTGKLISAGYAGTLLITGGDIFMQSMLQIGVSEFEPVCELSPGVVVSRIDYGAASRFVISKSGGFGGPELLIHLAERLENRS